MTDPTDPRTDGERRARGRRRTDPSPSRALTLAAPPERAPGPRAAARQDPPPVISAQLLGQDGHKRGLRGGPDTLNKARAAYLNTEFSGEADRRLRTGLLSKKDV